MESYGIGCQPPSQRADGFERTGVFLSTCRAEAFALRSLICGNVRAGLLSGRLLLCPPFWTSVPVELPPIPAPILPPCPFMSPDLWSWTMKELTEESLQVTDAI